jgi:hypothetical protein
MLQSKKLGRREVLCGGGVAALAAGVAAGVPFVSSHVRAADIAHADPLLDGVERYLTEMVALNSSRGLSDKQLDAWIDRADEILESALQHQVSTARGALAVLVLVVHEKGYNMFPHADYGDDLRARCMERSGSWLIERPQHDRPVASGAVAGEATCCFG